MGCLVIGMGMAGVGCFIVTGSALLIIQVGWVGLGRHNKQPENVKKLTVLLLVSLLNDYSFSFVQN